ncbi:MAG: SUMF1/EgtB/PvdO family nonheme iron enzyme, partial [Candidatus Dormibacteraeota bacterium]|nr:SUMF1/EgtB/PvdO family nonheme iron enzyme [Candidatus Dormibacteraeota bacterium]
MAYPAQRLQEHPHPHPKQQIARDLAEARSRTEQLLAPLDDERLTTQYDQLMSPPVWDYTHIGVFEELWLVQAISSAPPMDEELVHTYNALDTPRVVRGHAKLLDRPETAAYLARVRERTLALLEEVDLDGQDPLLRDGFIYDLILQHEDQHEETILQTIQLTPGEYLGELPEPPPGRSVEGGMISVPSGRYPIGSDANEPYDNEHPQHQVGLEAFEIDRFPVSNGDYLRFMGDGGYDRQELWSGDGWDWLQTFGVQAPEYWRRQEDGWLTQRLGREVPVDPRLPVCHVCFFEADAYARWAGKRLPSEFEWEVAAGWDPAARR